MFPWATSLPLPTLSNRLPAPSEQPWSLALFWFPLPGHSPPLHRPPQASGFQSLLVPCRVSCVNGLTTTPRPPRNSTHCLGIRFGRRSWATAILKPPSTHRRPPTSTPWLLTRDTRKAHRCVPHDPGSPTAGSTTTWAVLAASAQQTAPGTPPSAPFTRPPTPQLLQPVVESDANLGRFLR